MLDAEEKKRRSRKRIIRLAVLLFIVLLAGGGVYFAYSLYRNSYGSFGKYEVVKSIERSDGTSANYAGYNGLLLKYSRDGAAVMDGTGEFVWNGAYEMKDPIYDHCGDYVIVGDRGSKLVHIFNAGGAVNNITVDHPILRVQVAANGYSAIMMEADQTVYIDLYAPDGKKIVPGEFPIARSGFPLSFTLSEDGTRYLYSALDVASGTVKTNTGMYNFGDVGQNEINNMVGGITFDGTAVKVDFITNDIVVIYTDSACYLYRMAEKPSDKPIAEIKFDNTIRSVFSGDSYVGFVSEGTGDQNRYQVEVYDLNGKKILTKGIDIEYTGIQTNGQEIVFYNYAGCLIINTKGTIRYQGQFKGNVEGMFGISKNKYYLVKGNEIEIIQLKGAK